ISTHMRVDAAGVGGAAAAGGTVGAAGPSRVTTGAAAAGGTGGGGAGAHSGKLERKSAPIEGSGRKSLVSLRTASSELFALVKQLCFQASTRLDTTLRYWLRISASAVVAFPSTFKDSNLR